MKKVRRNHNHLFGNIKTDEDLLDDIDDNDDRDAFEEMLKTDEAEWYDITNIY